MNTALRKRDGSIDVKRVTKSVLVEHVQELEAKLVKAKGRQRGTRQSFYHKIGPSGTMVVGFGQQKASFYPYQWAQVFKDQNMLIKKLLETAHAVVTDEGKQAFKAQNDRVKDEFKSLSFRTAEERDQTISDLISLQRETEEVVRLIEGVA